MGNLVKTLHGEIDRTGSDDSGQTREFTQCTRYDTNLAESTAHGNKAASDLIPVVLSERSERRCDIPKTLSSKNYGARSDDSGQTREFTQSAGYDANLAESTTHGRQTTSDFAPVVLSERSERRCDIPKTLSSKNYGARSDDSGQTREFTQSAGNEPDFAQSTAHGR